MSRHPPLDVDALVIGGGPAGSACAIRLARGGARVAIVEASAFSRFRVGETLEPSVRPLLADLGIEVAPDCQWAAPSTGVVAAWGQPSPAQRPSLLNPYGRGLRIDRTTFDRVLFDQARHAGALALTQSRPTSGARQGGSWTFTLETPTGPMHGRTRWIVAATGRSASAPFAPCRKRVWLDRLVGIALISGAAERPDLPAAALVEAAPCGWWYAATTPNGTRLAVLFTDGDLLPRGKHSLGEFFRDQLACSPLTRAGRDFLDERIARRQWTGFDARSGIRRTAIADGWVAIGDALMAFDPLCGRGVTEALTSGLEVADWLMRCGQSKAEGLPIWATNAAERFNRYRAQRAAIYAAESRWDDRAFWQRRQEDRVSADTHLARADRPGAPLAEACRSRGQNVPGMAGQGLRRTTRHTRERRPSPELVLR
jgi:flavin-dependent dehydrogenase